MSENQAVQLTFDSKPKNGFGVVASIFAGRPAQAAEERLDIHYRASWNGAVADRAGLAKYREIVGLPDDGTLPPLYVHAMAMPVHMAMFTHRSFPLRLMGLLHFSNAIESLRPIRADEKVDIRAAIDGITVTDKGQSFEIITVLTSGGEEVWREKSTFLSPLPPSKRGKGGKVPSGETTDWGEPVSEWKVPGDAGRRFAGPANDVNPIHMSALTAKLFGFKSAIAHGMFSAARCVSAIQKSHPEFASASGLGIDVRFKRPLFIPGSVALHSLAENESVRFLLKVRPKGEPHIEGRVFKL